MVRKLLVVWCLLVVVTPALAGEVTVRPDRTTVFENESFNVEFSYSDEVNSEPGFDVLQEDFDIIAQNRRSNLQSFNGRFSYELSWSLTLMPKRTGSLVIPPVQFDGDRSRPVTITVKPAPVGDAAQKLGDLSLEVTLTPDRGYVQGQFIYTQRLYHRGWLAGGELSDPDFGDSDALVRQLDQVKRYSLFRDGERYQVYEQSYLVFPQSSGTLRASAADFTGQLREPGQPPRLKRVSAPAVSVEVLGVPDGFDNGVFLPAQSLRLEEEWPASASFEQGRPVTRIVKITAVGQTSAQLPAIDMPDIDGLRVYADQPRREDQFSQDGVTGTVEQSIALVPQQPGSMTLPAIELRWWDAVNKRAQTARLPARDIVVKASTVAAAGASTGADTMPSGQAYPVAPAERGWPYWPLTTFVFAVLWLSTLLLWQRGLRRVPVSTASGVLEQRRKRYLFATRSSIKKACDEADSAAASKALMDWARVIWAEDPPRSLKAISDRVDGAVADEIRRLDAVRFGRAGEWVEPQRLWRVVAQVKPVTSHPGRKDGHDPLAAL